MTCVCATLAQNQDGVDGNSVYTSETLGKEKKMLQQSDRAKTLTISWRKLDIIDGT